MSDAIDHPTPPAPEPGNLPLKHAPSARGKVFRRLAWLGGFLLVVLFALSAWALMRPGPAVYTLLKIDRRAPWIVFRHGQEGDAGQDFEAYGKEQVALVRIRPVLNAALRKSEASALPIIRSRSDPIAWLEKELEVTFDKDTGFLRIALRSGSPKDRIILVQAVRDAYLDEVVYKECDAKLRRLVKLKEFYLKSEDDLRQKRKSLKDMAKSIGGVNEKVVAEKQKLREEFLFYLRKELVENYSNVRKAQVKLALAEREKKAEDVARYQAELEYLKEIGKKLENDFDTQTKAARDLGDKAIDLSFFQKEIDSLDHLTNVIATQKQQLEIELDAPSRIHNLQDAILEDARNWQDVLHDLLSWLWQ